MKYIVLQVKRDGVPMLNVPFVFPDILVHSMVAAQMTALLNLQYFKAGKTTTVDCLSAGDLSSVLFAPSQEGTCGGKSDSLGVGSRGSMDDRLLSMCDYGSCMMVD